ncbi:MAG: hypothetical protein LBE20_04305 [Deltaproteobacteria bacterium]|jgi:hypothetical protein|nr:hypothetical protein [Deltaproteobacteria bacterium]
MNNKNEGGYISLTTHELSINESRNSNYNKNNRRRNNGSYVISGGRQTNKTNRKSRLAQLNNEANGNRAISCDEKITSRTAGYQKLNKNRNSAKSKKVEKLIPPTKGVISKTFKATEEKENKAFRLK